MITKLFLQKHWRQHKDFNGKSYIRMKVKAKFIVKKKRLSGEDFIFSVGVYPDSFGKTHVDISSDLYWQRWGSFNTELSLQHINEFYVSLNGLLKSH